MLTLSRRTWIGAVAMLLMVSGAHTAYAQQTGQFRQQQQQQQQQQQRGAVLTDRDLAIWLLTAAQGNIAASQVVQQRAQSEVVADFAQATIEDNQWFIEELQQTGLVGRTRQPQMTRGRQNGQQIGQQLREQIGQQLGQQQMGRNGQREQVGYGPRGGGVEFSTLIQQLGQRMTETARQEFQQKQGLDLDRAYLQSQVIHRLAALDTLQVISEHATSQELQQIVDDAIAGQEAQLEYARQLLQEVDAAVARQGTSRRQPQSQRQQQR